MTAKGTVFLALEDETGMVNVTLWPDTWARLRGVVRRHALLLVDGELQRESSVVNVIARRGPAAGRGRGRPPARPDQPRGRAAARPCRDAPPGLTRRSGRSGGGRGAAASFALRAACRRIAGRLRRPRRRVGFAARRNRLYQAAAAA